MKNKIMIGVGLAVGILLLLGTIIGISVSKGKKEDPNDLIEGYSRQEAATFWSYFGQNYGHECFGDEELDQEITRGDIRRFLEEHQDDVNQYSLFAPEQSTEETTHGKQIPIPDDRQISKDMYIQFYNEYVEAHKELGVSIDPVLILKLEEPNDGETDLLQVETGIGTYMFNTQLLSEEVIGACVDQVYLAYHTEDTVFYLMKDEEAVAKLYNAWITKVQPECIQLFYNGMTKEYPCKLPEDATVKEGTLADINIQDAGITQLDTKSDVITAKVLAINDEGIELEGYGVLPRSENYKIYKVYGEMAVEMTSKILVGYETTNFVVANGVVEAALITQPIQAKTIRVVLGNDDYTSLVHEKVEVTADCDFEVSDGENKKTCKAGESITIDLNSELLAKGRAFITTKEENGKIAIPSIDRAYGTPSYRGSVEIAPYEGGLLVINELPLEEYLYAVVPSEMPTSYGVEALKVQAICARGYAYAKLMDGTYAKYGAHLDDSTMTQVYNSTPENEDSIFAVKDTYGIVPMVGEEVISAFFFSTSCGVSCSNVDVWGGEALPYLSNQMQTPEAQEATLADETAFREFINTGSGFDTFEKEYPFYRWRVAFPKERLGEIITQTLTARVEADPSLIQMKDNKGRKATLATLGTIENVEVIGRGPSGIVTGLRITGVEGSIEVKGQTNARALLAPLDIAIEKQDGTTVDTWKMLPSPFYYVDVTETDVVLHGGGFGHGVGMSQNGAKAMANRGYKAEDIVKYYYKGITLYNIYTAK